MRNRKSHSITAAIIAVITAMFLITIYRLLVVGDLIDAMIYARPINVMIPIFIAALPAVIPVLCVLLMIYGLIRLADRKKRFKDEFVIPLFFKYLIAIFVFLCGYFAANSTFLFSVLSGIIAVAAYFLTYFAVKSMLENYALKMLSRIISSILVLLLIFSTIFIYSGKTDYLSSALNAEGNILYKSPPNILIIGLDGMDWRLTNHKIAAGELPNFEFLKKNGTFRPLHSIRPTSSPYIWNTLYTGYMPEIHRLRPVPVILPFGVMFKRSERQLYDPLQTMPLILTGENKKIRHFPLAFWEIIKRAGYNIGVIGNWTVRPLTRDGWINMGMTKHDLDLADLDYEKDYLHEELKPFADEINLPQDRIPESEWKHFFPNGKIPSNLWDQAEWSDTQLDKWLTARFRACYATDRFRYLLGKKLIEYNYQPYCYFIYLQGLDILGHYFMNRFDGFNDDAGLDQYDQVLDTYYQKMDEWIGELINSLDNTVLIIVSDHGFNPGQKQEHERKTGFHKYSPDGVFFMFGESLPKFDSLSVHVLDITPTILSLAGMPELATMSGRSILSEYNIFNKVINDWYNMEERFATFGAPNLQERQTIEELKSLGYIK